MARITPIHANTVAAGVSPANVSGMLPAAVFLCSGGHVAREFFNPSVSGRRHACLYSIHRGFLAHFRLVPLTPTVAEEAVALRRKVASIICA
jgi:hypothetical protein